MRPPLDSFYTLARCRGFRALRALAAIFLLFVLPATVAHAEGNADEADLEFQIGADLYGQGNYREALEHFLASNRLVPNRNVVYNIARTYEKVADRTKDPDAATSNYANAYRYFVDAEEGETDPAVKNELTASLARITPRVGVLRVDTTPAGATIYVERKDLGARGKSPRPLALTPGKYKIIVERQGYETAVVDGVEAKRGEETPVTVQLKEILGGVNVALEGIDHADVHVGDERAPIACSAPCKLNLEPGPYILYFTHDGYQADPRQVIVKEKETSQTTARFSPLSGSLSVDADEHGAAVYVDGVYRGTTPSVIANVSVGSRHVKISLHGYATIERDVDVAANKQTELLDLKLEPLHEVQAVSRVTEKVEDAPSSLTIIDGRELRAFGYPTIAESLRGVRGFYLSNDRAYWSAGVRGIGEPNDYGNRLLVLSDGASLNDDLVNSSYIGSDANTDLHDVERIEIVRGPGSLLYGTGAVSGVVNLVPRYHDNPTSVNVGGGTYENRVARGRGGFQVNFTPDAGMWASAYGARSDGFSLDLNPIDPSAGKVVTVPAVDRFGALGTAGSIWWKSLTAQWSYHRRQQQIPIGAAATDLGDPRTHYFDERALGEVRFEPKLGDKVQLFTRVHANHYHFNGLYVFPKFSPAQLENYYGSWFGGEARVVITPIKELRITAGGEVQGHPVAELKGTAVEDDLTTPLPGGSYLDEQHGFSLGAVYAILDAGPVKWFRIDGGVRLDIYSSFGAIAVPRGALIFKPIEGGVLKVMSGRAFRAPSIYEQFYNDGGISQAIATDPKRKLSLGPESIVSSEIEYSQRFLRDWVALVSGNLSYIEHIINSIPDTPGSDITRYANSTVPALTGGVEVELRREWHSGWMVSGFYGYQRSQYVSPNTPALVQDPRLVNAPEHNAGVKAVMPVLPELVSIGARAALEAPRRIDVTSDNVTGTAVVADVTLSGYVSRFGLRYVVGVYNLFDWTYALPVANTYATATMPQNGRTFLADIEIEYP